MARRRYGRRRHRGGRGKTLRIAATVGILVGAYGLFRDVWGARAGGAKQMSAEAIKALTGYWYPSGTWDIKTATFTIPVVAGCAVSMVGSKVGINKYMPKHIKL